MKLTFPRAQVLRFVDISTYPPIQYNHDNTLLQDEGRIHDEPVIYFQKFSTNDPILIYLITDSPTIVCKIYNYLNTEVQTVTLADVGATYTDVTGLYGIVNTSALGGIFYAKIIVSGVGLPTFTYQSEYFEVADFSEYPLIKWKDNDFSGIYYENGAIEFGFRIEADITGYKGQLDNESFEAYNTVIVNLRSKIKRIINFKTDEIPRYIYEKLILALGHNKVYINGIEYVPMDSPNDEPISDTQFYMFEANLAQSEYEVYDELNETSGGVSPTGEGVLSPDGINLMSSDGTDIIKIY